MFNKKFKNEIVKLKSRVEVLVAERDELRAKLLMAQHEFDQLRSDYDLVKNANEVLKANLADIKKKRSEGAKKAAATRKANKEKLNK